MAQRFNVRTPAINWDHPLTRKLILAIPMAEYGGINTAAKIIEVVSKQHATIGNTPVWKQSPFGPVLEFNGGTHPHLRIPRANLNWNGQVTVTMFYKPLDTPGSNVA